MRVALVHDWLNGMRGGEKVFEVLCELYPDADVHTLFYEADKVSPIIRAMRVLEHPLPRHFNALRSRYRYMLPFLPKMAESLPLKGYDLIISTSHCVAKGIIATPADTTHICYCFTPMRYIWEKYDDYFGEKHGVMARLLPHLRKALQEWDVSSANRVTHFLTSSHFVRGRIREHYLREAQVIPAPVDFKPFASAERNPRDFYLVVSALEPYKRVDVAVEAFRKMGLPLKIAGSGSLAEKLRGAAPPNVEFLGWVSDAELVGLYSTARAVIFPSDEDFGIVPLEAAAAGCPVIAYEGGGALETVVDQQTGIFFSQQTPESLIEALGRFNPDDFPCETLRDHAENFDRETFKRRLGAAITRLALGPTSPTGSMIIISMPSSATPA